MNQAILEAVPHSFWSWDYSIRRDGALVAELDQSWFRERAEVLIADSPHTLRRESVLLGTFALECRGEELARARKPSMFTRTFEIAHAGGSYELRAASLFRREMRLFSGPRVVGGVRPKGIFTREAWIELPEELPLPVQVFVAWLAIILWRRQRRHD